MPPHLFDGRTRLRAAAAVVGTAALLATSLTACGSSSESDTSSTGGDQTSPASVHLSFIYASTTLEAFQEMNLGAEAAANTTKVSFKSFAPSSFNGPAEVSDFMSALLNSKNGMAVEAINAAEFTRGFTQATEEGVPIVAVDTPPPEGKTGVTTFIGNSNTELGESLARTLLKKIPADSNGEVVLGMTVPGNPVPIDRDQGIKNVIEAERPNMTVVGPIFTGSEPSENYGNWDTIVQAHPHAVAFLGPGDQDAVSLARIEKATGKHYLVGACDLDPLALQAVSEGYAEALVDPRHWLKGYIAIDLLAEHAINGKSIPAGWWNPGSQIVTKSNVAEIITRQSNDTAREEFFKPIAEEQLEDPSKYIKPLSDAN